LIDLKNSSLMKTKLIYLGFAISSNELKMDPKNVKAIRQWPSPRNIFEVGRFHGLSSFYRKFIRNFSGMSSKMMDTVKKRHKSFNSTKEEKRIFNILKDKITEQSVLVLPHFIKMF
jgi:hypothetical protein